MSFINELNSIKSDFVESNDKKITMDDILKSKGSSSFAVRFIGQVQTALRTGKFVTDKAVIEFMNDRFDKVDKISIQFKNIATQESPSSKFEAKQIKSDQAIAKRLSKTFSEASQHMTIKLYRDSEGRSFDFKTEMDRSHAVLKALKAMDQYDPVDLLRAAVFEKNGEIKSSTDDLKAHFNEFIKDKNIQDKDGLQSAYQKFKNKMAKDAQGGEGDALEKMKSYEKDSSMTAYNLSSKLNLDPKGVNVIRRMSVSDVISAAKQGDSKAL